MKTFAYFTAAIAAGFCMVACGGAASDDGSDDFDEGQDTLSVDADKDTDAYNPPGGGDEDDGDDNALDKPVDPARELLVTSLSVVEDPVRTTWPAGPRSGSQAIWTFGYLMELMAGSAAKAPDFTMQWLHEWELNHTINGHTSTARPLIKDLIIDPWLAASGGVKLNMKKAPFRLLAIVNRPDLRVTQGLSKSAGEGRFVFGALKPDGTPMSFTVIFEYGVPALTTHDVVDWANKWHKLGSIPFGNTYNKELEKLTTKFSKAGCAPFKPNGSCINQIRTNEVPLDPASGWELREFRLNAFGALRQVVTAQTPDLSLNGTQELADYINANQAATVAQTHVIPALMLGPCAPESMQVPWNAPGIVDNEARHGFAISTCSGCHTTETGTFFLHVKNRAAGQASVLSGFLTGTIATDPVSGVSRPFNTLADRAADMEDLILSEDN